MLLLTQDDLKKILRYDSETGDFYWVSIGCGVSFGKKAGTIEKNGYKKIMIKRKFYMSHRLAFLWMIGEWPTYQVDHIDMNKGNNKWDNLRNASHGQQQCNRSIQRNNSSGYKGVSFNKKHKKWCSFIRVEGKNMNLGNFDDIELAALVYSEASYKYHREYGRIK